ncbi:PhoH family protein [Faecalibacillus intestinalis]|jgi:phosphate starvation-inducible PhoH-like protein|uniref:PhoH-like protein n=1 Tax=Faecalibacillus intestinalis TaxID=1982626 RepID=A0AAP2XLT9_9FIRM|nr:PhoH family protein [Faecalibacillus intestinalis]MCB8591446.1 PhoH family protein [Faecalibacillus intestinalis]MCB8612604.1 PhoH family protein [Faecalibacillus intestinalis]MCG4680274.1 PhoH family protein [Faecalibacillus intestinalis]MCG4712908.1 PhoH family protein [Faecalibacillus intestinalis]MCG4754324.1 PhoH family protein [Faecalibacillus intestinalis]
MKEIVKLEAYNIEQLVNLSGVKDENLEVLEDHFQVEISLRGDEMSIVGSQQQIEKTKKVIYSLLKLIVSGVSISRRDVIYAQKLVEKDKLDQLSELYHIKIARTYNGKLIYPKTLGQKSYYYALKNNDVVFGIGPAGTGKTYLAVVFAVAALKNNEVKKIILTRPAVEAGENLGFLPGDLKEKVDPYLRPLYDALYDMLGVEQTEKLMEKGVIEIAPLAYMRGRTLEDAYVILDEAQNTTDNQMKMFLTRLGFRSKMIVTGDISQIDLPRNTTSGLIRALDILEGVKGISFIHLSAMDVVRHPVVQRIIERYDGKNE